MALLMDSQLGQICLSLSPFLWPGPISSCQPRKATVQAQAWAEKGKGKVVDRRVRREAGLRDGTVSRSSTGNKQHTEI